MQAQVGTAVEGARAQGRQNDLTPSAGDGARDVAMTHGSEAGCRARLRSALGPTWEATPRVIWGSSCCHRIALIWVVVMMTWEGAGGLLMRYLQYRLGLNTHQDLQVRQARQRNQVISYREGNATTGSGDDLGSIVAHRCLCVGHILACSPGIGPRCVRMLPAAQQQGRRFASDRRPPLSPLGFPLEPSSGPGPSPARYQQRHVALLGPRTPARSAS